MASNNRNGQVLTTLFYVAASAGLVYAAYESGRAAEATRWARSCRLPDHGDPEGADYEPRLPEESSSVH